MTQKIPKGVVEGITDIVNGNTATKEEIAAVLKFGSDDSDESHAPK